MQAYFELFYAKDNAEINEIMKEYEAIPSLKERETIALLFNTSDIRPVSRDMFYKFMNEYSPLTTIIQDLNNLENDLNKFHFTYFNSKSPAFTAFINSNNNMNNILKAYNELSITRYSVRKTNIEELVISPNSYHDYNKVITKQLYETDVYKKYYFNRYITVLNYTINERFIYDYLMRCFLHLALEKDIDIKNIKKTLTYTPLGMFSCDDIKLILNYKTDLYSDRFVIEENIKYVWNVFYYNINNFYSNSVDKLFNFVLAFANITNIIDSEFSFKSIMHLLYIYSDNRFHAPTVTLSAKPTYTLGFITGKTTCVKSGLYANKTEDIFEFPQTRLELKQVHKLIMSSVIMSDVHGYFPSVIKYYSDWKITSSSKNNTEKRVKNIIKFSTASKEFNNSKIFVLYGVVTKPTTHLAYKHNKVIIQIGYKVIDLESPHTELDAKNIPINLLHDLVIDDINVTNPNVLSKRLLIIGLTYYNEMLEHVMKTFPFYEFSKEVHKNFDKTTISNFIQITDLSIKAVYLFTSVFAGTVNTLASLISFQEFISGISQDHNNTNEHNSDNSDDSDDSDGYDNSDDEGYIRLIENDNEALNEQRAIENSLRESINTN